LAFGKSIIEAAIENIKQNAIAIAKILFLEKVISFFSFSMNLLRTQVIFNIFQFCDYFIALLNFN